MISEDIGGKYFRVSAYFGINAEDISLIFSIFLFFIEFSV